MAALSVLGVLILALPALCQAREAEVSGPFFPLTPGSRLVYGSTRRSGLFFTETTTSTQVWEYLPARDFAGERVIPVSMGGQVIEFMRQDRQGLAVLGLERNNVTDTARFSGPEYLLRYPLRPGMTWTSRGHTRLVDATIFDLPVTSRVEATGLTVTVPAGTFTGCVKVATKGHQVNDPMGLDLQEQLNNITEVSVEDYSWYAPGVGLIKSVRQESAVLFLNPQLAVETLVLQEYDIRPSPPDRQQEGGRTRARDALQRLLRRAVEAGGG